MEDEDVKEAQALARALEAENGERIGKLLQQGVNPLSLQISAIQLRVEALIEAVSMPPMMRAQFEVCYEANMADFLDKAKSEVLQHKLLQK